MAMRRFSMCMNIEGFIKNAKFPSGYLGIFADDDGKELSPKEARDFLAVEKAKGRKVIPASGKCGNPCSQNGCAGFDYSGKGCPGYEIPEGN